MADTAHISGLIVTEQVNNPFLHCDIVTSTTHKSLRGPKSGIIFMKKKFADAVNFAVFPLVQTGAHNHNITALATQMKQVATPEFKAYGAQVVTNAKALAALFIERGEKIITGGTDTHMILWDMRPHDLIGWYVERVLDCMYVSVNKIFIVGDKSV